MIQTEAQRLRRILERPDVIELGTVAGFQGDTPKLFTVYAEPNGYGVMIRPLLYQGDPREAVRRANEPVWGHVSPDAQIAALHREAKDISRDNSRFANSQPVPADRAPEKPKARRGSGPVHVRHGAKQSALDL